MHFGAGLSVFGAFDDVLFAAACGLYHLVCGAVAVWGEEAAAEGVGQLVDDFAFLVEESSLPGTDGF